MYEHKGLEDIFFIMLYGGATLLAILSCCYLLFAPGNIFSTTISPSRELRRWAAAFLASVAASHIWWVLLGIYWLQDDRLGQVSPQVHTRRTRRRIRGKRIIRFVVYSNHNY